MISVIKKVVQSNTQFCDKRTPLVLSEKAQRSNRSGLHTHVVGRRLKNQTMEERGEIGTRSCGSFDTKREGEI